jgi:hypothetical protein
MMEKLVTRPNRPQRPSPPPSKVAVFLASDDAGWLILQMLQVREPPFDPMLTSIDASGLVQVKRSSIASEQVRLQQNSANKRAHYRESQQASRPDHQHP